MNKQHKQHKQDGGTKLLLWCCLQVPSQSIDQMQTYVQEEERYTTRDSKFACDQCSVSGKSWQP